MESACWRKFGRGNVPVGERARKKWGIHQGDCVVGEGDRLATSAMRWDVFGRANASGANTSPDIIIGRGKTLTCDGVWHYDAWRHEVPCKELVDDDDADAADAVLPERAREE